MSYSRFTLAAAVVADHTNLLALWNQYGGEGSLLGRVTVTAPLTADEIRNLPDQLREIVRAEVRE